MAHRYLSFCFLALVALLALPATAHAQYKNKSFGVDVSYQLITKPNITAGRPLQVVPRGDRGDRLHDGIRVGGEGSFKLHHDHWWFNTRLDLSFLGYGHGLSASPTSLEGQADLLGSQNMGLNMGVDGQVGVRYYFLTDHFRPYLQGSISYMHIFSFGANASQLCPDSVLCVDATGTNSGSYGDNFMPRTNIFAVHVAPSFEVILRRDLALHVILDYQRWVVFRGKGNNVFTMGAGLTFYG
jgi:hypothetical protein